jgi:hypothetical protein
MAETKADEDVDVSAQFPESAHVVFYEYRGDAEVSGDEVLAHGSVAQDGTIRISGLEAREYWMTLDGREPIHVSVKGANVSRVQEGDGAARKDKGEAVRPTTDGDELEAIPAEREGAATLVDGDPKSYEQSLAPAASDRTFVIGPRTSGNARIQTKTTKRPIRTADMAPEEEPVDKLLEGEGERRGERKGGGSS